MKKLFAIISLCACLVPLDLAYGDIAIEECLYSYDCSQTLSNSWCREKTGNPNAICSVECNLFCATVACDGSDSFIGEFQDAYSYNPGDICACSGGQILQCPGSMESTYSTCRDGIDAPCVLDGGEGKTICGRSITDGVTDAPEWHLCDLCGVNRGTTTTSVSTYINAQTTTTCSVSNYEVSSSSSTTYACKANAYGSATSATTGCYKCPDNATCNGSTTFTCNTGFYKNNNACSPCNSDSNWSHVQGQNYDSMTIRTVSNDGLRCDAVVWYRCTSGYHSTGGLSEATTVEALGCVQDVDCSGWDSSITVVCGNDALSGVGYKCVSGTKYLNTDTCEYGNVQYTYSCDTENGFGGNAVVSNGSLSGCVCNRTNITGTWEIYNNDDKYLHRTNQTINTNSCTWTESYEYRCAEGYHSSTVGKLVVTTIVELGTCEPDEVPCILPESEECICSADTGYLCSCTRTRNADCTDFNQTNTYICDNQHGYYGVANADGTAGCNFVDCVSDEEFVAGNTGYLQKAIRGIQNGVCVVTSTLYECAAGYYPTVANANGTGTSESALGCTRCPSSETTFTDLSLQTPVVGTSMAGSTSKNNCYIPVTPSDQYLYDVSGRKRVTSTCGIAQ